MAPSGKAAMPTPSAAMPAPTSRLVWELETTSVSQLAKPLQVPLAEGGLPFGRTLNAAIPSQPMEWILRGSMVRIRRVWSRPPYQGYGVPR